MFWCSGRITKTPSICLSIPHYSSKSTTDGYNCFSKYYTRKEMIWCLDSQVELKHDRKIAKQRKTFINIVNKNTFQEWVISSFVFSVTSFRQTFENYASAIVLANDENKTTHFIKH